MSTLSQRPSDLHRCGLELPPLHRLIALVLFIVGGCGAPAAPAAPPSSPQPNIVLILSDDMGYGDIGVHGGRDIPTPNIDRIAQGGVRFTDAYANGSFCTPTRAALMSGRYQHRHGNEDLSNVTGPLPAVVRTLPDRLRAAGYTTGMVGKWHLGDTPGLTPVDRGFDEFFGFLGGGHQYIIQPGGKGEYNASILRNREPVSERRYLTDAFGEEAAAFVERQRAATKPFFLYLAFNAVHTPLQATEKYLQRFAHIADPRRRTYAAMLSAMDDAIGLVLTALEQTGKRDNTLVVFHNDNGGAVNNGSRNTPLRGFKIDTWEGGIRVPLALQWPGRIVPGSVYRQAVITMDLTATALAAARGDAAGVEGIDLLPFVRGEKSGAPHDALFWRCRTPTADNCYAVRQGDWVYVHTHRYSEDGTGRGPAVAPERLFNLATDLGQRHDLAAEQPAKLASLKKLYTTWSAEVDADCRRLGIKPPGLTAPKPAMPARAKKQAVAAAASDTTGRPGVAPLRAALPRVLMLGDSISIGYTPLVIEALRGTADVTRPKANCGDTQVGLKGIEGWLGDGKWDVIHFNWGLWDLCYRNPESEEQGRRDKVKTPPGPDPPENPVSSEQYQTQPGQRIAF